MRGKSWVLSMGVFLLAVGGAQAQVIFSTSFSAAEGYVDGPITGQPAGGSAVWTDGYNVPAADYITVENGAMVCRQNGDDLDTWTYIEFPNQNSGDITVTFDWQYVGSAESNIDVGFCISDKINFEFDGNPALGWNEQSAMCRMQQAAAVIDVRNGDWAGGGTYAAEVSYPYTDGKKIHMRYEIDLDYTDQYLTVYAQKEGESEVLLANKYGFRREYIDGLNTIAIWVDGNAADVMAIIDNIVIFGPADISNWPLH